MCCPGVVRLMGVHCCLVMSKQAKQGFRISGSVSDVQNVKESGPLGNLETSISENLSLFLLVTQPQE